MFNLAVTQGALAKPVAHRAMPMVGATSFRPNRMRSVQTPETRFNERLSGMNLGPAFAQPGFFFDSRDPFGYLS
jgi:hypothetical protein